MLKTELAQRLASEFMHKIKLDGDHAMILAAGVDNGTLRAPQARMIAGLSADWSDAALMDASTSLTEIPSGATAQSREQTTEDRATASAIMSMARQQGMTPEQTKSALSGSVGAEYESLLCTDDRAFLKG